MVSGNIYDRIFQQREAAEALARDQAEQARQAAEALAQQPVPTPALPINEQINALCIAGLMLRMPPDLTFQKTETTFVRQRCVVSFSASIQGLSKTIDLQDAAEQLSQRLHESHPQISMLRKAPNRLAGHQAISLDYTFNAGQRRRYGRTVAAILTTGDGKRRQWLEVSTLIDPDESALADWLPEFDAMLANLTTA